MTSTESSALNFKQTKTTSRITERCKADEAKKRHKEERQEEEGGGSD